MIRNINMKMAFAIAGLPVSGTAISWLALWVDYPRRGFPRFGWMFAALGCICILLWSSETIRVYIDARRDLDIGWLFLIFPLVGIFLWFVGNDPRVRGVGNLTWWSFYPWAAYRYRLSREVGQNSQKQKIVL
jgi:hypothetical protein